MNGRRHRMMRVKQMSPKRTKSSMLLSSLLGVWLLGALSTLSVDVDTCVHATTKSGRKIMLVKKGKKKRVHR
jgi:mannose/fructose/N-acetylgalactosamine-specific phosphotransferase system component IID